MNEKFKEYNIPEDPKTYEEAVKIIKGMPHDEMNKEARNDLRLRAGLVIAFGTALSIVGGIGTELPAVTGAMLFNTAILSSPFWSALLKLKASDRKIESGKYFKTHSQEQIIKYAKIYLEKYREWAAKRSPKSEVKK